MIALRAPRLACIRRGCFRLADASLRSPAIVRRIRDRKQLPPGDGRKHSVDSLCVGALGRRADGRCALPRDDLEAMFRRQGRGGRMPHGPCMRTARRGAYRERVEHVKAPSCDEQHRETDRCRAYAAVFHAPIQTRNPAHDLPSRTGQGAATFLDEAFRDRWRLAHARIPQKTLACPMRPPSQIPDQKQLPCQRSPWNPLQNEFATGRIRGV